MDARRGTIQHMMYSVFMIHICVCWACESVGLLDNTVNMPVNKLLQVETLVALVESKQYVHNARNCNNWVAIGAVLNRSRNSCRKKYTQHISKLFRLGKIASNSVKPVL